LIERNFLIYDVFTDRRLAGNPLAIVLDCDGLDTAAMQKIAAEFNLSETVFIAPPGNAAHAAAVRIFTPMRELPFAGHPTVGTAIALAEAKDRNGGGASAIFVLEEKIGAVRCAVTRGRDAAFAEFDLPRLPQPVTLSADREAVAAALGLGPHEVGFENHEVGAWTAGVPYVAVPVRGLEAAGKVRLNASLWLDIAPRAGDMVASPHVYCRDTVNHDCDFHSRVFAPHEGITEDPATGSAAAAFAGQVMRFDEPLDGPLQIWLEQGIEMERPSRIRLEIDVENGSMAGARIGGQAVRVAAGTLFT
jgi:trans-2,3-dihydro-3-hydroxyanthranilate isomerase